MAESNAVRLAPALALALLLACQPESPSTRLRARSVSAETSRTQRQTVLFSTDFESGWPKGMAFDRERVWSVVDGKLRAQLPDRRQEKSFAYVGSEEWSDYVVDVDVCGVSGVDKGMAVRADGGKGVGIDLRGEGYNDIVMYRGFSQLGRAPAPNRNGKWYHLRVEVSGNQYRVYVNRALKLDYTDEDNSRPRGRVALAAYTGGTGACVLYFDNLVVTKVEERS
jgi:hypothetical protein